MAVIFARESAGGTFEPVSTMGMGNASQSQRGFMAATDKVKLDNLPLVYTSTADLTPGVSDLETGALYFVYEIAE